jgi:MFS family permease
MKSERTVLWRNRDYLLLWSGQALSSVGDAMEYIALPLLVLMLTHSVAQAGITATLQTLPFPLLSLPVGVLVDRWDRKRLMIFCDTGRALATGSIPIALWLGDLSMEQMYIVAIISGILATFFTLAETASLPNVVSKEQLPAAMGQNYATSIASSIIGPPCGGFLYALSSAFPFLVNAISYVVSVISLLSIRVSFRQQRQTTSRNFRAEILAGITWTWRHPLVRFLAFRVSAGNLVYGGGTLLLVVLATRQHAAAFAIGTIFAIEALGGIVASLLIEHFQRRLSFAQITIGLGWITALLFPLYAIAPNIVILGFISAVISFALVIFDVTQLSYRASIIPDEVFGRVTSSIRLLTVGALSLGAVLTGTLLQTIGPQFTILIFTIYLLLLALLTTTNKDLRSEPHPPRQEILTNEAKS